MLLVRIHGINKAGEKMSNIDISKELSKYSKEAIILTIKNNIFFKTNNILNEIRFNEQRLLINQMDVVNEEMRKVPINTPKNFIKWHELEKKWRRLDNKLNKLMESK